MDTAQFWTNLRGEFVLLTDKYPTVGVRWDALSARWTLDDLEGTGRVTYSYADPNFPMRRASLEPNTLRLCAIEFSTIARDGVRVLGIPDSPDPWMVWSSYVRSHAQTSRLFVVTGHTPCTEKEWDACAGRQSSQRSAERLLNR